MRLISFTVAAALMVTPAYAQRNRQPAISDEALRAMQIHEVPVGTDRAFAAIISAVTNKNYTVETANKDAGLITATENTKSKMSGVGMATKQNTIKLSIVVSSVGATRSRIRVNAIDNYVYTYHGKVYRDENTPVSMPTVYAGLYEAIDAELR